VLGDELVAHEYLKLWQDPDWGTLIRSTSPLVVQRIRKEHPELVPYLAPVKTPLVAEVDYLRSLYGADVPLVYAGVFMEESATVVDASITFAELESLLTRRGVDVDTQSHYFARIPEVRQRHVSAAGGFPLPILESERPPRRVRKLRGLESLSAIAHAVTDRRLDLGFVDLLPWEGTLDHPLLGPREELFWRRQVVAETEPPRSPEPVVDPAVSVAVETAFEFVLNGHTPTREEIDGVIEQVGRAPSGMEWDCRACGYNTCIDFATALLRGRAAYRQCPPYQERRAHLAIEQASRDELTGLATYKVLRDRLEQERARSGRNGEQFAVLFVDMDRFKQVNDQHGHEMGSRVLAGVGRALQRSVRQTDLAARYGGDEFVVVLVMTDTDGARRVGEVVRESVESLGASLGFQNGEVAVSVGVACHDPGSSDQRDVLESADEALYQAKGMGGNVVVVAGEDRENRAQEQV
jgi:diguanylate cyclase (GGDEF)-like protein